MRYKVFAFVMRTLFKKIWSQVLDDLERAERKMWWMKDNRLENYLEEQI